MKWAMSEWFVERSVSELAGMVALARAFIAAIEAGALRDDEWRSGRLRKIAQTAVCSSFCRIQR
jgi:hypothetical protein